MINTPDLYTFFAHSGNSSSIIDLTFANSKIENAITNWSIDENEVTGSDHEVIRFELIASFKNLTSHATALSNKYNCNKADRDKFARFLDENAINYESQIHILFYLFIECMQPKVMTLNYFKIYFYNTNKSTLYNPSMNLQFFPVFTPC